MTRHAILQMDPELSFLSAILMNQKLNLAGNSYLFLKKANRDVMAQAARGSVTATVTRTLPLRLKLGAENSSSLLSDYSGSALSQIRSSQT